MLSPTFLIVFLSPLLLFSYVVHGIPSKETQGDLTILSNRIDELTKKFNRKIGRLEAALNVQIKTNEEQSKEIDNLKLKVERLESRLDILPTPSTLPALNDTFKAQYEEFTKIFKNNGRAENEMERMAELVKEIGVEWIDRKDILQYGPDALLHLCLFYKGDNLLDIIKFFLSSGVDINCIDRREGGNMLFFLSARDNDLLLVPSQLLEISKFLISGGINVNHKDDYGNQNFLHLLSQNHPIDENLLDLFKLFLSNGADINITDKNGRNIFSFLSRNRNLALSQNVTELIQFLISSGIEVNHKDEDGDNALHYFSSCRSFEKMHPLGIIKLLISAGVDVNATNNSRDNALTLMSANQPNADFVSIIKLLISNGINLNHENNEGKTARDIIMENNDFEKDQDKQAALKLLK